MYLLNPKFIRYSSVNRSWFTFHYVSIKSDAIAVYVDDTHVFTFHYVSIKSQWLKHRRDNRLSFTFHYVSIKSIPEIHDEEAVLKFTFHYVSIKSCMCTYSYRIDVHLHSTMYLLNLIAIHLLKLIILYLHSTMYLLNH